MAAKLETEQLAGVKLQCRVEVSLPVQVIVPKVPLKPFKVPK